MALHAYLLCVCSPAFLYTITYACFPATVSTSDRLCISCGCASNLHSPPCLLQLLYYLPASPDLDLAIFCGHLSFCFHFSCRCTICSSARRLADACRATYGAVARAYLTVIVARNDTDAWRFSHSLPLVVCNVWRATPTFVVLRDTHLLPFPLASFLTSHHRRRSTLLL